MAAKPTDKVTITAVKRDIFGKQTKKLRREGKIPANIYGKDFSSLAVTLDALEFQDIYSAAGETGVVYVKVEGEQKEIPTLIRLVQEHPVTESILHVDLRKINLRQKIETEVPVTYTGEAPVEKAGGVVLYQTHEVTIEALPSKIPSEIEIDVSQLTEIGQSVKVKDLPVSEDYTLVTDAETTLVTTTAHVEEEVEPDTSTTVPEEEGEGAPEDESTDTQASEGAEAPSEDSEESKKE